MYSCPPSEGKLGGGALEEGPCSRLPACPPPNGRQGKGREGSFLPGPSMAGAPRGPGDADVATLRAALWPEQPMGPIPARLPQQPRPEAARASGRPARLCSHRRRPSEAARSACRATAAQPRRGRRGRGRFSKARFLPPPIRRKAGPAPPRRLGAGPLSLPGTPATPPPGVPPPAWPGSGPPPLGTARPRSPPARRAAFSALGSFRGPGGTSRAAGPGEPAGRPSWSDGNRPRKGDPA